MWRYDDIGAIPQRTFGGQRLRIENVKNGFGNVSPVEGALERVLVDDISAADVNENGLPEATIGQRFPGEQAFRLRRRGQHVADIIGVMKQLGKARKVHQLVDVRFLASARRRRDYKGVWITSLGGFMVQNYLF